MTMLFCLWNSVNLSCQQHSKAFLLTFKAFWESPLQFTHGSTNNEWLSAFEKLVPLFLLWNHDLILYFLRDHVCGYTFVTWNLRDGWRCRCRNSRNVLKRTWTVLIKLFYYFPRQLETHKLTIGDKWDMGCYESMRFPKHVQKLHIKQDA